MKTHYLSILGLDDTATESDIKSAYRKLSKRYHPDVNLSPDAEEQFIQIKEAYEYLIDSPTEATPISSSTAYEEFEARAQWRRDYQESVREKEAKINQQRQTSVNKFLRFVSPVAMAMIFFNTVLIIDFLLPLKNHDQEILQITRSHEHTSRHTPSRTKRYDLMYFEDFTMRFGLKVIPDKDIGKRATVQATPILSVPLYALITISGQKIPCKQYYNIYHVFGFLIPIVLTFGFCTLWLPSPTYRINSFVGLIMFSIFQLVIFNS